MIAKSLLRLALLAAVCAASVHTAQAQLMYACLGVGTSTTDPLVDHCGGKPALAMVVNSLSVGEFNSSNFLLGIGLTPGKTFINALSLQTGRNTGVDLLQQDLYSATTLPTVVIVIYGTPVAGKYPPAFHLVLTNVEVNSVQWSLSQGQNLTGNPGAGISISFDSLQLIDNATGQTVTLGSSN